MEFPQESVTILGAVEREVEVMNHQFNIEFLIYCMQIGNGTGFVDNIYEIRALA